MSAHHPGKGAAGPEGGSFAKALRDCLVSGLILIDGRKKITTLTPEAAHMLGLTTAQAHRPALEDLPAALRELVRESLTSGKLITDRQIETRAAGRGNLSLRVSAVPVEPGRSDAGLALVVHDLTPVRHMEAHLQQLDRLANVGTLAASMAHEIKNALVAGKTFVDLLLERNQEAELVEIVRRELGRIDSIVKSMLKFAGPARSGHANVRVHEVLEHSLRLVQHQMDGRLIALKRSFRAAPDLVHGDECALQQAFVNLLLNALDAMGEDGTLTVATETIAGDAAPLATGHPTRSQQVHVTIRDTGTGISAEHQERVFDPFFTTKPTGTGLGLAITRRIIEEHRGGISVDSQPGQGTTFGILLPALAEAAHAPRPEAG